MQRRLHASQSGLPDGGPLPLAPRGFSATTTSNHAFMSELPTPDRSQAPGIRSSRAAVAGAALLIAVGGLLAYHNSFSVPFVLDDRLTLVSNPTLQTLWPLSMPLSPAPDTGSGGRPFLNLTFAVNQVLGGSAVGGYHTVNLAIHVLAGLTLFGIVRRTLNLPSLRPNFGSSALPLAAIAALLWVVHPLQTSAVTYLSQRAESLMGLFYLLTLYCVVRAIASDTPRRWQALAIATCFLGIATKEVMVTAPVAILLFDRTFAAGSFRAAWRQRWRMYLGLCSSWILLGLLMHDVRQRGVGFSHGVSAWSYAMTECGVVLHYLKLAVWPHPLVLDYGMLMTTQVAIALPCALGIAVLIGGVAWALWRHPFVGFLGAWCLLVLAPTSSIVPVAMQPMAESRMYLPLAAVVVAIVLGLHRLVGRRGLIAGAALAVVALLATVSRNEDYRSEISIWSDTVAKQPGNARARNNLGLALDEHGQVTAAIAEYREALRCKPDYPAAWNNLGTSLQPLGESVEAVRCFENAIRFDPKYADAHSNLGFVLSQLGRPEEAIAHCERALQLRPDYAEAHNHWGLALGKMDRLPEAISHFEKALQLKPRFPKALTNLGNARYNLGHFPEAIACYRRALELDPADFSTRNNLGLALKANGDFEGAVAQFEEALRSRPDSPELHYNLALVLRATGHVTDAAGHYNFARQKNPALPAWEH
jgi:Flp pilus assembly protein TadD